MAMREGVERMSAERGLVAAAVVAFATAGLAPGAARACGGFFCDRPAAANPVPVIAQAAENVLFALDRDPLTGAGIVEAHIQIKYAGDADQFSWIVPLTSMPTLAVGSDVLFQVLEPATRPSFTTQFVVDGTCSMPSGGGSGFGCGSSTAASAGVSPPAGDNGMHASGPNIDVSFQGNIGPYETVVVRSDDAAALETWLNDHKYFVSPQASQIIQQYVATQSYFVALRLQSGHGVDEIQPLVVKLTSEEGCLPLQLTAIATTPDLRINVWVLGSGRAVPINYDELTLNYAKLDWFGNGANYDRLVSDAANEAGGNAFLVEYAQLAASLASRFAIRADAAAVLAQQTTPTAFIGFLTTLGIPLSGRVIEVLREQLPEPATLKAQGVTEAQFYNPGFGYLNSVPLGQFNAAAAAAQIETEVLAPVRSFQALFAGHAYLTRLATFISADEMTKDPLFVTNPTLPPVSNQHTAMAHVLCSDDFNMCAAPVRLDLPDGGPSLRYRAAAGGACVSGSTAFDRGTLDTDLPAAERVYLRDATGPGTVIVDQTAEIAKVLRAHDGTVPTGSGGGCAVPRRARSSAPAALVVVGALVVARLRRRRPRESGARTNRA